MPALTTQGPRLTGPGIALAAHLSLPDTAAFRANRALFPQGFDTYLTCGSQVAGLPRSTIVEAV
jgi:alpha-D-ribose 1-methylphosphonate 5-triphosphate synthase subunit PhnH